VREREREREVLKIGVIEKSSYSIMGSYYGISMSTLVKWLCYYGLICEIRPTNNIISTNNDIINYYYYFGRIDGVPKAGRKVHNS
jgi:hypothetical protein